ncbi:MAG: hypothetical protein M3347_15485, partial [Armatimonadota bacterium]|nr:hypothetical protein [Armatimonadota bacterium]
RLRHDLQVKQVELSHHDAVQQAWAEGEARRAQLDTARQERARELNAAQARWTAREMAHRREAQLSLLLQHVDSYENASHEAAELAERVDAARTRAADLPAWRERLHLLEEVEKHLRQRADDQRAFQHIEAELAVAERKQGEAASLQAKLDNVEVRRVEVQARLDTASRRVEHTARQAVPGFALTGLGVMLAISGFITGLLAVLGIAGLLLIVLGAALMVRARAATAAARAEQVETQSELDALTGERRAVAAQRHAMGDSDAAALSARIEQLKAERDRLSSALRDDDDLPALLQDLDVNEDSGSVQRALEGTRREVAECQAALRFAQDLEQQQTDKAQQTTETLQHLRSSAAQLDLRGATPAEWKAAANAEREAMRAESATTPDAHLHAEVEQAREAVVELDRQRARLEGEQTRRQAELDARSRSTLADEQATLKRALEMNAVEQERLATSLRSAADLPALLQELGVAAESESVQKALQATRQEVLECEASANAVVDLEKQQAAKACQVQDASRQVHLLAEELPLPGATLTDWKAAAFAEREAWQAERSATPDAALNTDAEQARQVVAEIDRQSALLDQEQARRRAELEALPRAQLDMEREAIERALAENATEFAPLSNVRQTLADQGWPVASPALRTHLEVERTNLQRDQAQAAQLPAARQKLEANAADVAAKSAELAQTWRLSLGDEPVPAHPEQAHAALSHLRGVFEQKKSELDEPHLRAQEEELQKQEIILGQEIATRRHQQDDLRARQKALLAAFGAGEDASPDALLAQFPELARTEERDIAGWEQTWQERQEAVRHNRSVRLTQAESLGIGEELLDLVEAERSLGEAEKNLAVKRRASEIVAKTRHSIVSRVMPLTMQNMSQLLPLLTEGRYRDVQWDEANNVLSVFDTRARAYQRKRVFSGGARDQISLALRLAFALATLPGEHNVRPGWLFLDEPLSSFDRNRTQALVDLLTRGLIRQQFAQIFLVSHSESFDPSQFDHRLRMADGRVVESTLPEK